MSRPEAPADDDLVPVSVRLGEVVPPEDPEDWTRPLTWVAALGMLAAPIVATAWFLIAPPTQGVLALPATHAVGMALAAGAAATGATQQGAVRAGTATLGAGLFGALVVVIVGVVMAGERQIGVASSTLSHAFAAAAGGLVGVAFAAMAGAVTAIASPRLARVAIAVLVGAVAAMFAVAMLLPGEVSADEDEANGPDPTGRSTGWSGFAPGSTATPAAAATAGARRRATCDSAARPARRR